MEMLRNPPFIKSYKVNDSSSDAPSDQDTFQFRDEPKSATADHDDWIPIETMSPPIFGPGQSGSQSDHTTWIPIETMNQSPHKPGRSGDQQDQPIFETGQDSSVTFDDYSFF